MAVRWIWTWAIRCWKQHVCQLCHNSLRLPGSPIYLLFSLYTYQLVLFQKGYYNTNGTTMDNVGVRTVDLGRSILITITLFALCNFFWIYFLSSAYSRSRFFMFPLIKSSRCQFFFLSLSPSIWTFCDVT